MLEHGCDAGKSSVALCMMCPAERRCIISSLWMLVAVCGSHMMLAYSRIGRTILLCKLGVWFCVDMCECFIAVNTD